MSGLGLGLFFLREVVRSSRSKNVRLSIRAILIRLELRIFLLGFSHVSLWSLSGLSSLISWVRLRRSLKYFDFGLSLAMSQINKYY